MKGLVLAEQFFHGHGLPMILACFPLHAGRMACGPVGDGSVCFCFDNELSRDHDWGPGFCPWLSREDCHDIGPYFTSSWPNVVQLSSEHTQGQVYMSTIVLGSFSAGYRHPQQS